MNIKPLLFFIAFSFLNVSIFFSQSTKNTEKKDSTEEYVNRITNNISLTKEEKTKLYKLRKEYDLKTIKVNNIYKNHTKLNEERLKINVEYSEMIVKKFGKKRGIEILEASKVLKGFYLVDNKLKNTH